MEVMELKRVREHRRKGYYPFFIQYHKDIPPNTGYRFETEVPTRLTYIVSKAVFDVEDGIFKCSFINDGKEIMSELMITGDLMECKLTEPYVVINKIEALIVNTDTVNEHRFRATIYMLTGETEEVEKELE